MADGKGVSAAKQCRSCAGKLTIGVGRNLLDRGLSVAEISFLYETDYQLALSILDIWLEGWEGLPIGPQLVLISMGDNLGASRLASFVQMRAALSVGDLPAAAYQALDSKWAGQVGRCANETAALLRGRSILSA